MAGGKQEKLRGGLFDNEAEANLRSTTELCEAVLVELGHRLDEARVSVPGCVKAWRVTSGSALVDVTVAEHPDGYQLRVTASVMALVDEVDRAALFERLLSLNANRLIGDAFALRGDRVLLVAQRPTRDLDHSEVRDLVARVSADADHYDDRLLEEFGGRRV